MRGGELFHKVDILAAIYIGGIECFTNIVGYLRGGSCHEEKKDLRGGGNQ